MMTNEKILVTGASGQLGSEIRALVTKYAESEFVFTDVQELDITQLDAVMAFVGEQKVTTVVNCAAYTAVDKAEQDEAMARLINATAVHNIVKACESHGCRLVHVSTDYVFDGTAHLPLNEEDGVSPLGIYGRTKYEGEQYVLNASMEGVVVRTSWLYSAYGNNFVKTMMRLGREREELGVIVDQIGTPTYARDLAEAILSIIHSEGSFKSRLYHFSNEGVASWYDFAKAIMEMGGIGCRVKPISTSEYPTPAQRPHYSVMNKARIREDYGIEIPYWRDSLKNCLVLLGKL